MHSIGGGKGAEEQSPEGSEGTHKAPEASDGAEGVYQCECVRFAVFSMFVVALFVLLQVFAPLLYLFRPISDVWCQKTLTLTHEFLGTVRLLLVLCEDQRVTQHMRLEKTVTSNISKCVRRTNEFYTYS